MIIPELDDDGRAYWTSGGPDVVCIVSKVLARYPSHARNILQAQLKWDRVNGVEDDTQAGEQNGITAPFILR